MEKTLKDHLIDAFDDLEQDNLKRFKDKLCDRREEPRVRRAQIEKHTQTWDLATLMVETFTSRDAAAVTIEILEAIRCNEQAMNLREATGESKSRPLQKMGNLKEMKKCAKSEKAEVVVFQRKTLEYNKTSDIQDSNRQVSQESVRAPSSGVNGGHFIDRHRTELINRVNNVDAILDELLQEDIISHQDYDEIRSKSTSSQKMRDLLSGPLKSAGTAGKDALYEALKKLEVYLMKELEGQ